MVKLLLKQDVQTNFESKDENTSLTEEVRGERHTTVKLIDIQHWCGETPL